MIRVRAKTWCSAFLVALVSCTGAIRAAEVTVIGSRWQESCCPIFESPSPIEETVPEGVGLAPSPPSDGFQYDDGGSLGPGDYGQSYLSDAGPLSEPPYSDKPPTWGQHFGSWIDWCGPPHRAWAIDYRCRSMTSSNTSYEFGTPELPPNGWTPLSRLDFALNSLWHGLRVGVEQPRWGVQFEWMMPQQGIQGGLADYDWNPPNTDGSYTDLGFAEERWSGGWGQMIDMGMQFQLRDRIFDFPIEIWPMAGFRWQRFEMTCKDLVQVKYSNNWLPVPYTEAGDVLTFNQQYYMGYLGGQLRTNIGVAKVICQADWGATWAYNVDHHLAREGNRFTMDSTQGDTWHVGVSVEVPLDQRVSLGFQYDHLVVSTVGSHHLQNLPFGQDQTWNHGVRVSSNQNWITGFVRFRF